MALSLLLVRQLTEFLGQQLIQENVIGEIHLPLISSSGGDKPLPRNHPMFLQIAAAAPGGRPLANRTRTGTGEDEMVRTAIPFRRVVERLWGALPFFGGLNRRLDRLERMSHGGRATYVGNNRVLTKCVIGEDVIGFLVEADDRLLGPWLILTGQYETPLTNYFLSNLKPDSHCLDVGANFGYFTCLMARNCPRGKVLGIEPDRHVYELVRDNININGLQGLAAARQAAVGDREGRLTLHRRITRSASWPRGSASRHTCPTSGQSR
jgi:hypothetical protein